MTASGMFHRRRGPIRLLRPLPIKNTIIEMVNVSRPGVSNVVIVRPPHGEEIGLLDAGPNVAKLPHATETQFLQICNILSLNHARDRSPRTGNAWLRRSLLGRTPRPEVQQKSHHKHSA